MSTGKRTNPEEAATAERRRTGRFSLVVPVEVEWIERGGVRVKEEARARNVSVQGALLQLKNYPRLNSEVTVKNSLTGGCAQARLTGIRRSKDGKLLGVAVELVVPSETFWGMTFQLQRSSFQLLEIELALRSQDFDFRVLRGLREAVEYLCKMASAVQQWQDLRLQGQDAYAVLPVLAVERTRRTTHLLNELSADLDALEVTGESEGFKDLIRAVERLYDRLTSTSPSGQRLGDGR